MKTYLQGIDADIETSLKEYGFAWREKKGEYVFYYGVNMGKNERGDMDYTRFDWATFPKNTDPFEEFDWVEWEQVCDTTGATVEEYKVMRFPMVVWDLFSYYGYENVFGSSYWEGFTYQEVIRKNRKD
jgi:hypothetical protein